MGKKALGLHPEFREVPRGAFDLLDVMIQVLHPRQPKGEPPLP